MISQLESINILCATDDNYAPYCGIMLTSLFESNRDCRFLVFILIGGHLTRADHKKFRKLEQKYNCVITFITIDDRALDKCQINSQRDIDNHAWVSKATYYRLLASDILPNDVQKVIYLDCDIVVVGDIKPLWKMDLSEKAIAGVMDCDEKNNRIRIGNPTRSNYINAGVSLYNLDYWRKNHLRDRFFECAQDEEANLLLMDQDVVNKVLFDKMVLVPERFNFQVAFFSIPFWDSFSECYRQTIISENKVVAIIHYVGPIKPWDYRYYGSPYYSVWNKYRKKSFWKRNHNTKPVLTYFRFLVRKLLSSKTLKKRRQVIWSVFPENEFCFE